MDLFASPVALAAVSAFCFAGSHVAAKRGLGATDVVGSLVISLSAAFLFLASASALRPPSHIDPGAFLIFVLAGMISPGVARWAAITGVDRLGPSISVPITQGARPLIAVMAALLFLGESVTLGHALGIAAIVAGGWILSTERIDSELLADAPATRAPTGRRSLRKGIAFPLIAAAAFATSDVLIRHGFRGGEDPIFAAMVGIGAGLAVWGFSALAIGSVRRSIRFKGGIIWNILSGLLVGVAALTLYRALDLGDVSLVSPIAAMQPLAVFALSAILLREFERLNFRTVGAGVVVVAGCVLVAI